METSLLAAGAAAQVAAVMAAGRSIPAELAHRAKEIMVVQGRLRLLMVPAVAAALALLGRMELERKAVLVEMVLLM